MGRLQGPLQLPRPRKVCSPFSRQSAHFEKMKSTKPCLCPKPRSFIPNKAHSLPRGIQTLIYQALPVSFPSFFIRVFVIIKNRDVFVYSEYWLCPSEVTGSFPLQHLPFLLHSQTVLIYKSLKFSTLISFLPCKLRLPFSLNLRIHQHFLLALLYI